MGRRTDQNIYGTYKYMKQHHFNRSKLAELMTFEQYTELNKMHVERQHTPYPVPLNKSLSNSKGANLLTRLVIKHAKYSGHEFIRTSNQGTPIIDPRTKKLTGWRTSQAGRGKVLDITGNIYGEMIEIEIKYGRDKLSPEQAEHLQSIHDRGGLGFVIRTYSDYIEQVTPYFDKEYFKQWKLNQLNDTL